jgi:hypothetical protein
MPAPSSRCSSQLLRGLPHTLCILSSDNFLQPVFIPSLPLKFIKYVSVFLLIVYINYNIAIVSQFNNNTFLHLFIYFFIYFSHFDSKILNFIDNDVFTKHITTQYTTRALFSFQAEL